MDIKGCEIRPTKHFALSWMRKWGYDIPALTNAIQKATRIDKVGKSKYEAYVQLKHGGIKIIFIKDEETKQIIVITGAEGR